MLQGRNRITTQDECCIYEVEVGVVGTVLRGDKGVEWDRARKESTGIKGARESTVSSVTLIGFINGPDTGKGEIGF